MSIIKQFFSSFEAGTKENISLQGWYAEQNVAYWALKWDSLSSKAAISERRDSTSTALNTTCEL